MGLFHDALAGIRGEDGSINIGEDFETNLTSAYDADMQGPNAAAEQAQLVIEELRAQLTEAQAANWLLVKDGYGLDGTAPNSDPDNAASGGNGDGEGGDGDGDETDDDEDFDDMFGEDDDDDNDDD